MAADEPTLRLSAEDLPAEHFVEVEIIGQIDRYQLLRRLGSGAFGAVFLAHDSVAGIEVAIKSLPQAVSRHGEALERTRRNFSLVTRLSHSHIANARYLHEAVAVDEDAQEFMGIRPGDYLIVMDYAPGVTLGTYRHAFPERRVPLAVALALCRQIAAALDYAHHENIIHRDVKPGNILVDAAGKVCVLDFGLAASIEESAARYSRELQKVCGTKQYMAPEQWLGRQQGPATDQYALAVLFYELVSGAVPFADVFAADDRDAIIATMTTAPVPPVAQLSRRQNRALRQALSKDPAARFPSCQAFVAALATPASAHRFTAAVGRGLLLVCLALTAVVGAALWFRPEWLLPPEADPPPLAHRPPGPAAPLPEGLALLKSRTAVLVAGTTKFDRGQGFGALLDQLQTDVGVATTLFETRAYTAAYARFVTAEAAAKDLLALEATRQAAAAARATARAARADAARFEAPTLAGDAWTPADKLDADGGAAFEKAQFKDAALVWGQAAKTFQRAATAAAAHRGVLTARQAWQTALAASNTSVLAAYAAEDWEQLAFSVRVAERQLQEGAYDDAAATFQQAAASLPPLLALASRRKAEADHRAEVEALLRDAADLLAQAAPQATDRSRRKDRFRLYERAQAVLAKAAKAEPLPEPLRPRLAELAAAARAEAGLAETSPKDLVDWRIVLGPELVFELAYLPAGEVLLGSLPEERAWAAKLSAVAPANEGQQPVRAVLKYGFWMSRTEVPLAVFEAFTNVTGYVTEAEQTTTALAWHTGTRAWRPRPEVSWRTPGYAYPVRANFPVTGVSWHDAVAFCQWLTAREREARRLPPDEEYRLPTEAEWEYACRAVQRGRPRFWWGDNWADAAGRANVCDQAAARAGLTPPGVTPAGWDDGWAYAAPVDAYGKPGRNPFGLADLLGNVAEWVLDAYDDRGPQPECVRTPADLVVVRGGSFLSPFANLRCAARAGVAPHLARQDLGFRIVCGPLLPAQP